VTMGRFVMRKNQRFRTSVPVLYRGKEVAGEGMVKDLSLSGWQIRGNETVSVGMSLVLRVFLPEETEPLRIDPAIVQWVKGLEFGVEFDTPPRKVLDRIEQIIAGFVQKPRGSSSRGSLKRIGKVSGT
jgi:PilZ domain-containing protein